MRAYTRAIASKRDASSPAAACVDAISCISPTKGRLWPPTSPASVPHRRPFPARRAAGRPARARDAEPPGREERLREHRGRPLVDGGRAHLHRRGRPDLVADQDDVHAVERKRRDVAARAPERWKRVVRPRHGGGPEIDPSTYSHRLHSRGRRSGGPSRERSRSGRPRVGSRTSARRSPRSLPQPTRRHRAGRRRGRPPPPGRRRTGQARARLRPARRAPSSSGSGLRPSR